MFENVIGNNQIKDVLLNSVSNNRTSHSYLFIGIEGIGKKLIAKEFAKMLLCLNENKYCSNCKSCIEFDSDNNPDFSIIEPDGNSIKIEQIRYMQRKVQEKPIISDKKVYIINDADLMTQEAQNCLLKTLEEPPEFVTIILIGSNENAFLSTIKSRCMILHFNRLKNDEIEKFLKEKYQLLDINSNMLNMFQGSIKNAISLKDKQEQYNSIENLVENLNKINMIQTIKKAEILYKSKEDILEMLDYMNVIFLKLAKEQNKYTKCIEIVEDTRKRLKKNANYDMSIDNMLFNIWEEIN